MERQSSLNEDYDRLQRFLEMEETAAQSRAQAAARGLKLDHIQIQYTDGGVLALLLKLNRTKKAVEFGTLTGFSATNILTALPSDGFLWTFEFEEKHAALARETLREERGRFEVIVGDGVEKAKTIESHGPFDAVFVDANKAAYLNYLRWAEENLRPGGLVIFDNILLHGELFGELKRFSLKQREVMKEVLRHLRTSPRWELTIVPASDGFAVGVRR